ncbi:MAG: DUF393 domain-containing protein [Acidobacteria bacterium]|nr:MAG: DUF393 domain-containing protein [Acidobacteriota bacterium]
MSPVLFYDGGCALCAGSVRFVLRHERQRTLRFASLEGAFARSVLARHPGLQGLDTVVWYEPAGQGRPERLLTRSAAVLKVLRYLGGPWRLGLVAAAIPRAWRDAVYRLVARHRRRLFGRADSCALPPHAARHRFLDERQATI